MTEGDKVMTVDEEIDSEFEEVREIIQKDVDSTFDQPIDFVSPEDAVYNEELADNVLASVDLGMVEQLDYTVDFHMPTRITFAVDDNEITFENDDEGALSVRYEGNITDNAKTILECVVQLAKEQGIAFQKKD